jgi:hypothetical protein
MSDLTPRVPSGLKLWIETLVGSRTSSANESLMKILIGNPPGIPGGKSFGTLTLKASTIRMSDATLSLSKRIFSQTHAT